MALSGTLETFSLPDVLRLLASTKKTGLLVLDGDRGTGQLWVDDGEIVAADAERSVVDDVDAVLFELLRFTDAAFEFDAGATPPAGEARRDVEAALEVAGGRLDEWREIEAVVPSLDVRVRMATDVDADVTVTPDVWRLLACVGTGATGHDVARHLAQGEYEVCAALRDLVERDLVEIEVVDAPPAVADAFAAMVSAPDPAPVDVYEVPAEPVAEEPVPEVEAPAAVHAPDPFSVGVDDDAPAEDDDALADLALLSPRAAAAVEATWSGDDDAAPTPEADGAFEADATDAADAADAAAGTADAPAGEAQADELDQNLLLRFLSSAKH